MVDSIPTATPMASFRPVAVDGQQAAAVASRARGRTATSATTASRLKQRDTGRVIRCSQCLGCVPHAM